MKLSTPAFARVPHGRPSGAMRPTWYAASSMTGRPTVASHGRSWSMPYVFAARTASIEPERTASASKARSNRVLLSLQSMGTAVAGAAPDIVERQVTTPIEEAWILAADEPSFRHAPTPCVCWLTSIVYRSVQTTGNGWGRGERWRSGGRSGRRAPRGATSATTTSSGASTSSPPRRCSRESARSSTGSRRARRARRRSRFPAGDTRHTQERLTRGQTVLNTPRDGDRSQEDLSGEGQDGRR